MSNRFEKGLNLFFQKIINSLNFRIPLSIIVEINPTNVKVGRPLEALQDKNLDFNICYGTASNQSMVRVWMKLTV